MKAMRRVWTPLRCVPLLLLAIGLSACGGESTAPAVAPTLTITSGTAITLVSGTSSVLTVRATDRQGRVVGNPALSWSSADPTVAAVNISNAVVGIRTGTTAVNVTYDGVTASVQVTVTPGPAARLDVRTAPAGATAGAPLATQPVIELRDLAGNLATGASNAVTASIVSGGGSLAGSVMVNAANGVATFSTLRLDGITGPRVIRFESTGLQLVESTITLQAGAPAALFVRVQPDGAFVGATFGVQPVVEIRDASGNLVTTSALVVTAAIASGGGTLGGTISVTAVGGVATFTNLALIGPPGPRTLSFSAPGLTGATSAQFVLGAGAPTSMFLRAAPTDGGLNSPFVTQPTVELRDIFGNVATGASNVVTATIASGGGTLTGATATAVNGVATFVGFGITGAPGVRTIAFTSVAVPSLTVTVQPCDASRAPQIELSATTRSYSAFVGGPIVTESVSITDRTGSCTAPLNLQATITAITGGAWLSASVSTNPRAVALRVNPAGLIPGTYTATVSLTSSNAGAASVAVTLSIAPSFAVTYGTVDQVANPKVLQLDPGESFRPGTTVRDNAGAVVALPVVYQSRSPSIASVAADGTITARADGQAWVIARVNVVGGLTDSVFANVTRGPGPVLKTDVSRFAYDRGSTFSVTVQLDTRGVPVSAMQVVFTWPSFNDTPGMLRLIGVTGGSVGNVQYSNDANYGTTRLTLVSATPLTGVITLARFDFTALAFGTSQFTTRFVELLGPDQSSLAGTATALSYPVIVR